MKNENWEQKAKQIKIKNYYICCRPIKSLFMLSKAIQKEFLVGLGKLERAEQGKVLAFIKSLLKRKRKKHPKLLALAGSISAEDLNLMQKTIEEGCENIDSNGW
jgi:hypothetical protein